jgi:CBS domain-containing protein
MFAKDLMKEIKVVCTEDMSLMQVYQLLQDNGGEFIAVVEDYAHKNPIGVITEHDICMQVVGKCRNPRGLTAASVMNTEILKTLETSTLGYCADLLKNSRTKRLFVVNDDGALCGTLTQNSIDANKNERRLDTINRSNFLSEFNNSRINQIL